MIGNEVDRANPEGRYGVAAIHPLAKAEQPARGGDFRAAFERLGPHDRCQHFQLRQLDAEIAAEQPAPRTAGEHDGIAGDAALFGDRRRHASARGLDAAHRALGDDRGAMAPRRLGDRRGRPLRFGLAVAGGVERAGPGAGQTGHQLLRFAPADDTGIELILAGMVEPGFELGQLGLRLGEIHDPGLAKAGLGLDHLVHALPQPQALDDQRDLARIPPHLAAPAPIAARLLAGDVPLLAKHGRDPLLRQKEGRAGADDPAADDHDIGARRQRVIGADRIDARRHG